MLYACRCALPLRPRARTSPAHHPTPNEHGAPGGSQCRRQAHMTARAEQQAETCRQLFPSHTSRNRHCVLQGGQGTHPSQWQPHWPRRAPDSQDEGLRACALAWLALLRMHWRGAARLTYYNDLDARGSSSSSSPLHSPTSTSASASQAVVTRRRSTPSARPSAKPLSPTRQSTRTRHRHSS